MDICGNVARGDWYVREGCSAGRCNYGGWSGGDAAGEAISMRAGCGTVNCNGDIRS